MGKAIHWQADLVGEWSHANHNQGDEASQQDLVSRLDVDWQKYKALKSAAKWAVALAKAQHYAETQLDTAKGAKKIFHSSLLPPLNPGYGHVN